MSPKNTTAQQATEKYGKQKAGAAPKKGERGKLEITCRW